MSTIEWTQETWNPTTGCTPVSPGCLNCYAARMALRLEGMKVKGYAPRRERIDPGYVLPGHERAEHRTVRIAEVRGGRPVFTGRVECLPDRLDIPLRRRTPTTWFVDSMSDLFHEAVPIEFIALTFGVMAVCGEHTFQILTKRPERMAGVVGDPGFRDRTRQALLQWLEREEIDTRGRLLASAIMGVPWPLPNVHLGTSVEDQPRADERIPWLLKCPAAVRFLSCEPLLGPVDLRFWFESGRRVDQIEKIGYTTPDPADHFRRIDWVIAGGESGPNARPCDVAWIRSIVAQCQTAKVPVFVKQLGSVPVGDGDEAVRCHHCGDVGCTDHFDVIGAKPGNVFCTQCHRQIPCEFNVRDPKGGDPAEWPADLRVREMPAGLTAEAQRAQRKAKKRGGP